MVPSEALNDLERGELAGLEETVGRSLQSFVEVGTALTTIRDRRLYRELSPTFEGYCQTKWGFTRRRADQLISAVAVVQELTSPPENENPGSQIGENRNPGSDSSPPPPPASEKEARAIADAPKEKRAATWKKAVETAPKDKAGKPKVTAAHVRRVVKEEADPPAAEQKPETPKDQAGAPVTDSAVAEAFANAARFDRALSLLTQVATEINPLLGDAKGARPLPGGEVFAANRQQTLVDLKNLRSAIRFARPFAVCPYPHAGRATCPACKGLGWVVEQTYDGAPSEYKVAAASGKGAA